MASIQKDIIIDADPANVWDALRDFGALHTRLAPGFVTDTRRGGDAKGARAQRGLIHSEVRTAITPPAPISTALCDLSHRSAGCPPLASPRASGLRRSASGAAHEEFCHDRS